MPAQPPHGRILIGLKDLAPYWTLHGGGAAAFHLCHRIPDDLDFFMNAAGWTDEARLKTPEVLFRHFPQIPPDRQAMIRDAFLHQQTGTYKINFEKIKLSFVFSPKTTGCIDRVGAEHHLPVASLQDVMGIKMFALCDRDKLEDYWDIATMIEQGWHTQALVEAAQAIAPYRPKDTLDLKKIFLHILSPPDAILAQLSEAHIVLLHQAARNYFEAVSKALPRQA